MSTIQFYDNTMLDLLDGALTGARICLVTNSYVFSAAHAGYSDISASELPTGNGYTAGGQTLANVQYSGGSGGELTITCDGCSWLSLTATFRYAILVGGGDELLACYELDDEDIVISASNYTLLAQDGVLISGAIGQQTEGT